MLTSGVNYPYMYPLKLFAFLFAFVFAHSSVFASTVSSDGYHVQLRWKPVSEVSKYKIQIARSAEFKELLLDEQTSKPEADWSYTLDQVRGSSKLFYRVASVGDDGSVGEFSKPKELELPVVIRTEWSGGGSIQAGIGMFNQWSNETTLKGVSLAAPYIQQRLAGSVELRRFVNDDETRWQLWGEAQLALFRGLTSPRTFDQVPINTYLLRVDLNRWTSVRSAIAGVWRWSWGATLDRSFRWTKSGTESVDAQGAMSVGPAFHFARELTSDRWFRPASVNVRVSMPLTGLFTNGHAGAQIKAGLNWKLPSWLKLKWHLRAEADVSMDRWAQPASTWWLAYGFWVAPVFALP